MARGEYRGQRDGASLTGTQVEGPKVEARELKERQAAEAARAAAERARAAAEKAETERMSQEAERVVERKRRAERERAAKAAGSRDAGALDEVLDVDSDVIEVSAGKRRQRSETTAGGPEKKKPKAIRGEVSEYP